MSLDFAIHKRLGRFTVDAACAADSAGIIALFGPSGAGKTTILRALAGSLRPDRGHIRFGSAVFFDSARRIHLPPNRRRIGYVFQDAKLFPHLRVRDNLLYGWRRAPVADRRIGFDEVVALLAIGPLLDRRPAALSGGERQRVALGRALLAQPWLLLMDEPFASLDAGRKAEILPFVERLRDTLRLPVVYVSHALDEVIRLADTIVVLGEGRVIAAGPILDVLARAELRSVFGTLEYGGVLEAEVIGHDQPFGLSVLGTAGGRLRVPWNGIAPGGRVRVRIRARDVALALCPPEQSSVLNVLAGRVTAIESGDGPDLVVRIDLGGASLPALVTRLAVQQLDLAPGREVHAMIKAVALTR